MSALVASQRDEGLTVGFRRPRTDSCRKPRSGSHPSVAPYFQDFCSAALSTFSDTSELLAENGRPSKEAFGGWESSVNFDAGTLTCIAKSCSSEKALHVGESSDEMNREREDESHRGFEKIANRERGDWKIGNRWDSRRGDALPDKNPIKIGKKIQRDGEGVVEKPFRREDNRHGGTPENGRMKKLEKVWNENFDRNYKDLGHRGKFDHSSKEFGFRHRGDQNFYDSRHRDRDNYSSKDFHQRWRDHFQKDSSYRDRTDSLNYYRDRNSSKDYSRDRDYQDFKRSPVKERCWKSADGKERRNSVEHHDHREYVHQRNNFGGYNSQEGHCWKSFEKASGRRSSENGSDNRWLSPDNVQGSGHRPSESSSDHRRKSPSNNLRDHENEKSAAEHQPAKLKFTVGRTAHTVLSDGRKYPDTLSLKVQEGAGSVGPVVQKLAMPVHTVPEPNRRRQRLILQENSDDDDYLPPKLEEQVLEAPIKETMITNSFNMEERTGLKETSREEICAPTCADNNAVLPLQAVRKSLRIPRKRVFNAGDNENTEPKRRCRRKNEQDSDDQHQVEEGVDVTVDNDVGNICWERTGKRKQRKRVESDSSIGEGKKEAPLTARQRALQFSKEGGDTIIPATLIEFPQGLINSLPKKKKEVLSEAEQQLKKEEAARKRRQNAKEIQAVAIQKILSQDSQRKKREDKLQKQREELEQEKKAAAMTRPLNVIRWVMGPSGTVVSFSHDIELPKIFSGPRSYPGERERCAAPSCNNAYKYRDSKSSLPLCSLQCYKAVQKLPQAAH